MLTRIEFIALLFLAVSSELPPLVRIVSSELENTTRFGTLLLLATGHSEADPPLRPCADYISHPWEAPAECECPDGHITDLINVGTHDASWSCVPGAADIFDDKLVGGAEPSLSGDTPGTDIPSGSGGEMDDGTESGVGAAESGASGDVTTKGDGGNRDSSADGTEDPSKNMKTAVTTAEDPPKLSVAPEMAKLETAVQGTPETATWPLVVALVGLCLVLLASGVGCYTRSRKRGGSGQQKRRSLLDAQPRHPFTARSTFQGDRSMSAVLDGAAWDAHYEEHFAKNIAAISLVDQLKGYRDSLSEYDMDTKWRLAGAHLTGGAPDAELASGRRSSAGRYAPTHPLNGKLSVFIPGEVSEVEGQLSDSTGVTMGITSPVRL